MKGFLATIFLTILCLSLFAQWSTNPAVPNQVCSLTNTQVMPKTAITESGFTWVAWMDNLTGTYYTYLQKLDITGTALFANPLLVSSHTTDTWLTDWEMDCDPQGNAVLCFQDLRLGTNNVVIYKISPEGDFLWGADGIMLSNDSSIDYGNMAPTVLCLEDGRTVAAWQRSGTSTEIVMQSLSPTGTLEWGLSGIAISSTTYRYTWPQFLPSDNNCVLLKYYEDSGPGWAPTRHILVQKYSAAGVPQWLTPTVVQGLGGISAWNQILSLDTDGMNGMLICWHDDRNGENISYTYIQRIMSDGSITMPLNGVRVSTENGFFQFYPKLAYEPALDEVYVFYNRVNGNQDMWGLQMQKLSLAGESLWGSNGMTLMSIGEYPTYPIRAYKLVSGIVFVYSISPTALNDQLAYLESYGVDPQGNAIWGAAYGHIATTSTLKLHYDIDISSDLWFVLAWEDGSGSSNIDAMRMNYTGSLGYFEPTPFNLTANVANDNDVILHWEFPEVFAPPVGFKVYRNGFLYHSITGGAVVQDTVFNLGPGLWSFTVTAFYESGLESPPSNEATINITGWEDEELPLAALRLTAYPNPFRDVLMLKTNSKGPIGDISIYNLKGQLIRSWKDVKATELTWDGKDSNNRPVSGGIYLIKARQGNYISNHKVLKY